MKKKHIFGLFAVLASAILGVGLVNASGFGLMKHSGVSEEDFESNKLAVQNAIETGDYASWEMLMQDRISWMEDFVTEENFEMLQEQHQDREEFREAMTELKNSGEVTFEDIEALREQYGVEKMGFGGNSERKGQGNGMGNKIHSRFAEFE